MIPILYKLRDSIRFEKGLGSFLIVSEVPLNVIRASERAARLLRLCDGKRTLREIASETGIPEEEQVFRICDYFNKKAFLETALVENQGYFPSITVIVPTKDRKEALVECLESLSSQDYPPEKVEIIIIDDGSRDGTQNLKHSSAFKVLVNPQSLGQSYCRNLGAKQAKGEILAFLDSDCVAGRSWLKDLVLCFQWGRIGAVGGYVDGYSDKSPLERYEKIFSPLNLGKYILFGANNPSNFYIPGCNLLIRKETFFEIGGVRESLHLGEDVDLCWRMRETGHYALYVPTGIVMHKHRNRLVSMSRRRADYGTSEAILYGLHPKRRKRLRMRLLPTVSFLELCLAAVLLEPLILFAPAACFTAEAVYKVFKLRGIRPLVATHRVFSSVMRIYLSFFYFGAFHLIRFYLVPLILLGFFLRSFWLLSLFLLMVASLTDYFAKSPRLGFPAFLFYYTLDHISYQIGVFMGCVRQGNFRPYKIKSVSGRVSTVL